MHGEVRKLIQQEGTDLGSIFSTHIDKSDPCVQSQEFTLNLALCRKGRKEGMEGRKGRREDKERKGRGEGKEGGKERKRVREEEEREGGSSCGARGRGASALLRASWRPGREASARSWVLLRQAGPTQE